jgi:hypothetical protein
MQKKRIKNFTILIYVCMVINYVKLDFNSNLRFLLFNALFVPVFFGPLRDLMQMSLRSDTFSYIPFIPIISAYLLYSDRK